MGIPILSDIFNLVGGVVDKIFPDKDAKIKAELEGQMIELSREELKARLKMDMMQTALEENKLLMQDMSSARDMFMAELKESDVPKWAKAWRVLNRPLLTTLIVGMWAFNKIAPFFNLPHVEWGEWDSIAMISVVSFYFGIRTFEKVKKSQ